MNTYLSAVNQRRYFASLLLEQLVAVEGGGCNPLLNQALCQSVLYQLQAAYRFYLCEVATTYKCREPEQIQTVEALIEALQVMGKHPAEASEMANLEQQEGSWLYELLSAYRTLSSVQQEQVSQQSQIAVVQVTAEREAPELSCELLSSWRDAFDELIERHRQHMLEC